jgi:hypothetical protein
MARADPRIDVAGQPDVRLVAVGVAPPLARRLGTGEDARRQVLDRGGFLSYTW